MKYLILIFFLLVSCEIPPTVSPKPNVHPAMTSNAQTRASIKTTRKDIGDTRQEIKAGSANLQAVDSDLAKLLVRWLVRL